MQQSQSAPHSPASSIEPPSPSSTYLSGRHSPGSSTPSLAIPDHISIPHIPQLNAPLTLTHSRITSAQFAGAPRRTRSRPPSPLPRRRRHGDGFPRSTTLESDAPSGHSRPPSPFRPQSPLPFPQLTKPLTSTHSRITSAQFPGAPRRSRSWSPSPLPHSHPLPQSTALESAAPSHGPSPPPFLGGSRVAAVEGNPSSPHLPDRHFLGGSTSSLANPDDIPLPHIIPHLNAPLTLTHSRITSAQFAGAPRRTRSRPPSPLPHSHPLPQSTTLESAAPSPGPSPTPSFGGSRVAAVEGNPELNIDLGGDDPSLPLDLPSQAEATVIDGSNQLFSMYNEAEARHDRERAERWETDADSAVIVNGFFSVMLAILLTRSYDGLKLNSQDASAFYLSQIYQLSAGLNGTSTPLPFEVPAPSTFSPDPASVRASALWSLSLVISLAGTVTATLLRQWARRYLHLTQEPRGPHKRARIRELTAQGVERLQLQSMSLVLPGLFHLSVLLFLFGLFHYSNSDTVDVVVLSSALICFGLYLFASIASYFPFGSICHTPLSFFAWSWSSRLLWLTYKMLYNSSIKLRVIGSRTRLYLFESARVHLARALRDPGVDMEDLARKRSSFLDTSVVSRLFDSLDGHQDLARFLSAIPGFYNSSWVKRDVPALEKLNGKRLAPAIASFMAYSLSSGLLTEHEKQRRIMICLRAINADPILLQCTFWQALQTLNSDIFRCTDFIRFAFQHLREDADPWVKDYAQCIVAVAINRVQPDNGAWVDLIQHYLNPQHSQYQGGDNTRLCNLMYLTQRLMTSRLRYSDQFERGGVWRNVLTEVRKFEVTNTAPELQHEFCALWNQLTNIAQDQGQVSRTARSNATQILSIIRTVYVPLHEATDSAAVAFSASTGDQDSVLRLPTSYPLCNVHGAVTGDIVQLPLPLASPLILTHSHVTSTQVAGAPRSRSGSRSRSPENPSTQVPVSLLQDASEEGLRPDTVISPPSGSQTAGAGQSIINFPQSPPSFQQEQLAQWPIAEHRTAGPSDSRSLGLIQEDVRHSSESLRHNSPALDLDPAHSVYRSEVTLQHIPFADASMNWSDGKKRSIGLMHSEQVSRYVNKGDVPRDESSFVLGPMQVYLPKYSQAKRPKGWTPATHPGGAVYFYHAEWKMFTDVYMYDRTLSAEIQAFALYLERTRTSPLPTNNYDLVLDVINIERDEIVWAYYFVDHDSKTLFWQDTYDCGDSLLSEVHGVKEASHVKLRLESLYWVHWSLYPTCPDRPRRIFPRGALKELLGSLLSSGIDSLSSKVSTSPYSVAELESMRDFIKDAESFGEDNPHVITSVARLLSFYAQWRFVHFHGQKTTRQDRYRSIYKDRRRKHTKLFRFILSPLFFFFPDAHLRELEKLWTDDIIVEALWRDFMQKLVSEWTDFVLYSTVMLVANVAFLAIPGVIVVSQSTSPPNAWINPLPAQIMSSISLVFCIGSIITGLLLIRRNRNMMTKDARRAWYYLHGMNWNWRQVGLEPLAIVFSLTYALLMWSAWGFFVALLIFCFQNMSRTIWISVGTAAGIVTGLIVWCIINTWDSEEREEEPGREWFLTKLKSYSNLRRHTRSTYIGTAAS